MPCKHQVPECLGEDKETGVLLVLRTDDIFHVFCKIVNEIGRDLYSENKSGRKDKYWMMSCICGIEETKFQNKNSQLDDRMQLPKE